MREICDTPSILHGRCLALLSIACHTFFRMNEQNLKHCVGNDDDDDDDDADDGTRVSQSRVSSRLNECANCISSVAVGFFSLWSNTLFTSLLGITTSPNNNETFTCTLGPM